MFDASEAVAGRVAVEWLQQLDRSVRDVSGKLKTSPEQLAERVDQLLDRSRARRKRTGAPEGQAGHGSADPTWPPRPLISTASQADFGPHLEGGVTRTVCATHGRFSSRNKLGSAIVVLGTGAGDKALRLVAGVDPRT